MWHQYAVYVGKYSEHGVMTFRPIKKSHDQRKYFKRKGCDFPDDELKSASIICMKFSM